jgi:hypothetical protein
MKAHLYTRNRAQYQDGSVKDSQSSLYFYCEINVSYGAEDVYQGLNP